MNQKYIHVRNIPHLEVVKVLTRLDVSFGVYGMSIVNNDMIRTYGIDDEEPEEVFTMLKILLPCEIKDTLAVTHK